MSYDWTEVVLKDVIEFNPRESLKKGQLTMKIAMDALQPFTRKVSGCVVESFSGGAKFRNGDTLLARITPCLENGKTAYVDILDQDQVAFGSTEFIVMRATPGKTDSKYVYYLATSPSFRSLAIQSMTGTSGRQRVQNGLVENALICIPTLAEQISIGAVLSSLDDKIELNNRINKTLEEMAQAIFKQWFIDFDFPDENGQPYKSSGGEMEESELGLIPQGWRVGKLSDICDILSGGTPKTSVQEYWDGNIPFFTPKDANSSYYVLKTEKTVTEVGLQNCNSKLYPIDTIFITARGTVGKVALAGRDMAMNQSCYALKGKNGFKQYFLFFQTLRAVEQLKMGASGAVFDAIVVKSFDVIKLTIPSEEIVSAFNNMVAPILSSMHLKTQESIVLHSTRDSLLPKLMSGEIRVPVKEATR